MNRKEWQEQHGFNDNEMIFLEFIKSKFNGKITEVRNKALDYEIIKLVMDENIRIMFDKCRKV